MENLNELVELFGSQDKNLTLIKKLFGVEIFSNSKDIIVDTTDEIIIQDLTRFFSILIRLIHNNINFGDRDIIYIKQLIHN